MTAVWVGGTFDQLHIGHLHLLRAARALGDVTVAVNTDDFVEAYKGRRPVQPLEHRLEVVDSIRWATQIQVNPGGVAQPDLILRSRAGTIVIGDDWWPQEKYLPQLCVDQDWLDRNAIRVVYVARVGGHSSTRQRAALAP